MMKRTPFFSAVLLALSSLAANAQTTDNVLTLPKVTVNESSQPVGVVALSSETIALTPVNNPSLSELLRFDSAVQFQSRDRLGAFGANLSGPLISIRGAQPYASTYLMDGFDNNNNFSPRGTNLRPTQGSFAEGGVQSFEIDPALLESLTVYDENVPVEFGGFTGGVVDAKMRSPNARRWHGNVGIRHTNHHWAHQYKDLTYSSEREEKLYKNFVQPDFKKTTLSARLEGPILSDRLGLLIQAARSQSSHGVDTPVGDKDNTQKQTNLRVTTEWLGTPDFKLSGTFLYAPLDYKYWSEEILDGDYDVVGGGLGAMVKSSLTHRFGTFSLDAAWTKNESTLDTHHTTAYEWQSSEGGPNWKPDNRMSHQYLTGTRERKETKQQVRFKWKGLVYGESIQHRPSAGVHLVRHDMTATNKGGTRYTKAVLANNVQGNQVDGIWAGNQYLSKRAVSSDVTTNFTYTDWALWLQDDIRWGRVNLRPGVRVSGDTLTDAHDVAPRFMADVDVLNNDKFHVTAGASRYYGRALLSFYTQPKNASEVFSKRKLNADGTVSDWTGAGESQLPKIDEPGDLKTPFSDELTLGFSAKVDNVGLVKLALVGRDYKDQLKVKTVGRGKYELTNEGSGRYRGVTLSLENAIKTQGFGTHSYGLSVTRSSTKMSTKDFAANFEDGKVRRENQDFVVYEGKVIPRLNLPVGDYDAPWVAALTHTGHFFDNRLRTGLTVRWEGSSDKVIQGKAQTIDGQKYESYEKTKVKSHVMTDLTLSATLFKRQDHALNVSVDINNVFNTKVPVDVTKEISGYQMGRQFFVGLNYTF